MSNKYKDSMNKIAMDEDMKKRITANLKSMQDINYIEDKNNKKCINNIKYVNDIESIDVVKKSKASNRRLKIVRNLGMYAACCAVVLGGMAIKPFMSLPNLDRSVSESSNIVENDNYSDSSEDENFMNSSEDISSRADINEGNNEKNQGNYSLSEKEKALIKRDEKAELRTTNDKDGTSEKNGSIHNQNYIENSKNNISEEMSQVNGNHSGDNSENSLGSSNIGDIDTGRNNNMSNDGSNYDNIRNNFSSDIYGNEGSTNDKNNVINNEVSGSKASEISLADTNNNMEGRSTALSFDNLSDLKRKADFDFKVCEVLENNYSKSEIDLILNEIVDITYTNNDNNIEFKICKGEKNISELETYEKNESIKVNNINFNLRGNGNSIKAVEWYEDNMSYSIQSSKSLSIEEAVEMAESLKTFK